MRLSSVSAAAGIALLATLFSACSDDDGPTEPTPNPPLGLSVNPVGSSTIRITFNSAAGDNSYIIERAEGTSGGSFTSIATVQAPATPGVVTYDDMGLSVETTYRYRVAAVRGSKQSSFTSEQSGTTLAFGTFTKNVVGDITANTTWFADTTYTLTGFVHVTNGATLTIQPGTTIKGQFEPAGASLFILRGAKIQAIGTASAPIVFTSSRPVGSRQPGDWGGLIIVGNATINRTGVDIQLEGTGTYTGAGTPGGENYTVNYNGGTTDSDNSGELRYVRVEFAGYAPSNNNELNSFTFAAVGSGTRLSYLQSIGGLDDSFEWFGGTVDASHLVSYESGDDHFDMSEGYRGRMHHVIGLQTARLTPRTGAGSASSDPQGIENDGCEGAGCTLGRNSVPLTTPVVANFTLVGPNDIALAGGSGGIGIMVRRGVGGWYTNGIVARWPRAAISLRDAETFTRAAGAAIPDLATSDLAMRNILVAESPVVFQTGTSQNAFDLAGNNIVQDGGVGTSQFTAFPATITSTTGAAAFDWTPPAGASAAAGGLATFAGKLATAAGSFVAGTPYRGAAEPGGAKWWVGWTIYARQ